MKIFYGTFGSSVFLFTFVVHSFRNTENMKTKEQSVRAQINDLEVGDAVGFPLSRIDYILSCRTRLQNTTGKRFSSRIDGDTVFITREIETTPDNPGIK